MKDSALDVYAMLQKEESLDYDHLKLALLQRFELTEDGFKRKFRTRRKRNVVQFSVRMSSYLRRWLKMAKIPQKGLKLCLI